MEQTTGERNWAEQAPGPMAGYAEDPPPFGGYAFMTGLFLAAFSGAMGAARASGRELPERVSTQDVVLVGVASHKLSRLIAKDRITSFVRAPFTEFQQPAGHAEVDERPRGRGLRRSFGELLTCPYCLAQWVTAGFAVGLVYAPRATRLVATVYTAEAISDFLQLAYKAGEDRA
jgi:uncharacterized protein DUF1360